MTTALDLEVGTRYVSWPQYDQVWQRGPKSLVNNTTRVFRAVYRLSVPSHHRYPENRAPEVLVDDCAALGNCHARKIHSVLERELSIITNETVLWLRSILGLLDPFANAARRPGSRLLSGNVLPDFVLVFAM